MQKSSLLLAVTLAFAPLVWANDVTINGTGVSLEPTKRPLTRRAMPTRWRSLPKDYHLAVPGKFTVAVAA
jgi:polar amino acid transport system substrate-binding protein